MPFQGQYGEWYDDQGNHISANPSMGGYDQQYDPWGGAILPDANPLSSPAAPNSPAQPDLGVPQVGVTSPTAPVANVRPPRTLPLADGSSSADLAGPSGGGTTGGGPDVSAPNLGGGALAPYSTAPPTLAQQPAYVAGQFKAPTLKEALNDPGYQFRTQQGTDALQRWAAARGTLNDSGTAKALIDYGQNAAEQGYGNVYARDYSTFNTNENNRANAYGVNRQTQYIDPWTAAYNTWKQQGDFYLGNQGNVVNGALGFGQLVNTL